MLSSSARSNALAISLLAFVGCSNQPPAVFPDRQAATGVGLLPADAIQFQTQSQPDDAASHTDTLDLRAVIELTARNSPAIQSSLARVRIAQADAKQARLFPNPVLNIALRFPENGAAIIDAGLSADLLAVLKRPGAINITDTKLRAASAEAITVVLDELTAAKEHYLAIQSLDASSAVLRERRAVLDRLYSLADSKLRIGEGNRLDVITLQTQRVELEAEIADRELELRDQRISLARMIGQPSSDATWILPAWTAVAGTTTGTIIDERQCISTALEHRPEIQQRQWELEAFGYERKLAPWAWADGSSAGVESERDGEWSVGPGISTPLPLLDVGQAQREKALALVIESRHQLTTARRLVIEETRRAYAALKSTQRNLLRVKDQLIPLQEERLKQAESQFRAGQTDITALLLAEQDLRSARTKVIDLQYRVALASIRLERAMASPVAKVDLTTQPTTSPNK